MLVKLSVLICCIFATAIALTPDAPRPKRHPQYHPHYGPQPRANRRIATGPSYPPFHHPPDSTIIPHHQIVDRPVYIKEPEPIIEIIIKESNVSLPPAPTPPPQPKPKKEQVQVFYVKYKKNPNGHGKDSVIYEKPVPAITPHLHQEEEEVEEVEEPVHEVVTQPPLASTTLRTIIRPESETYHSPSGVKVTFGKEGFDYSKRSPKPESGKSGQFPQGRQLNPFPSNFQPRLPQSKQTNFNHQAREPQPYRPFNQQPRNPIVFPSRPLQYSTLPKYLTEGGKTYNQRPAPPQFQQGSRQPVAYQPFDSGRTQQVQFRPQTHFPVATGDKGGNFQQFNLYHSQGVKQGFGTNQELPTFGGSKVNFNSGVLKPSFQDESFGQRDVNQLKNHQLVPKPNFQPGFNQDGPFQQDGFGQRDVNQLKNHQLAPKPNFQQSFNPDGPFQQDNFGQRDVNQLKTNQHFQPDGFGQREVKHSPKPSFQPAFNQDGHHQQDTFGQRDVTHLKNNQQAANHFQHDGFGQREVNQLKNSQALPKPTFQQPFNHQHEPNQHFNQQETFRDQFQTQNLPQPNPNEAFKQEANFQHASFNQNNFPQEVLPPGGELIHSLPKFEQHISVLEPSRPQSLPLSRPTPFPSPQPEIQPNGQAPQLKNPPTSSPSLNFTPRPAPSQEELNRQLHEQLRQANALQESIRNPHFQLQASPTTPRSTTVKSTTPTTTTETITSTTKSPEVLSAQLPDEVPEELRAQLLSSGILNHASISILDYDKVGDIPLSALPPDQLANFYSAGGGQQLAGSDPVPAVLQPDGSPLPSPSDPIAVKPQVEMKVVHYDPQTEKGRHLQAEYVQETAKRLQPVELNANYTRYLPLKVSGTQFPLPDAAELRGRRVTSVVVLAPVRYDFGGGRITRGAQGELVRGVELKALLKKASGENFRRFFESEAQVESDRRAVILLVARGDGGGREREIFMYDAGSGGVSRLDGALSSAFVEAAEANAEKEEELP